MTEGSRRPRVVTRRNFLYLSGLAATGLVATACGGGAPLPGATPQSPAPTAAQPTGGAAPTAAPTAAAQPAGGAQQPAAAPATARKEAPQLAELVKGGKLPPVEGRLPKNPVVVKPVERVGKYGGAWRMGLVGGQDTAWLTRTLNYEHLVRWDPEWKEVVPNVAESFEASPDARVYTFKLREGLKWSDGQPYTADDILFWYEDIVQNKEIAPAGLPSYMKPDGKPGVVEKVDAWTVRVTFPTPNGLFLQKLATPSGDAWTRYPKHYLQQFHQKYNPGNVERLARENNVEGWAKLFQTKGAGIPGTPYDARWSNPELPTLHAWAITAPYGGSVTRVVAERNPFYFKVDTAGNQLPYLDRLTYEVAQEAQTLVLKALNGEIDLQDRHIATLQNKAVFSDNQQKGGYKFVELIGGGGSTSIALNLTHKDPTKRQIFQNKDFRIGLSHAIDRQQIIDVVYVGQGQPWQVAPHFDSEVYHERLAKQYTEYDVRKANEHLDKAGFAKKDGEGFRLGPDGKRISFIVEVTAANTDQVDTLNIVEGHWRRVGIDMQVKVEDRALMYTRKNANEHDACVWGGGGGVGLAIFLDPRNVFPFSDESNYGQAWATWFTNPSGAGARTAPEEPPAPVKRQMELYRQLEGTGDRAQQAALMKQLLDLAADQFYVIGINLGGNGYGIIKNNFKNVPPGLISSWEYPTPGPTNPSQYFVDQ